MAPGPSDKLLDKYFQFFTHLSTLNSAGAVIVLAVSQTQAEGMELAVVPLVVFGLSLLASLSGMEALMVCLYARQQRRGPNTGPVALEGRSSQVPERSAPPNCGVLRVGVDLVRLHRPRLALFTELRLMDVLGSCRSVFLVNRG